MLVRRRHPRLSSSATDQGFTFVEVLVAVALLSTLCLFIWEASARGGTTVGSLITGVRRNGQLVELDAALRSYTQRVVTPYWLSGSVTQQSPEGLTVSYLDGNQKNALRISFHDHALIVSDGVQSLVVDGVQDASADIATPPSNPVPVLVLTVRFKGREPTRIIAGLGGRAFPVVRQP